MTDIATDSTETPAAGFLGVERSLGGKLWLSRGDNDRQGLMLAQRLNLPEIVGRVLAGRGVGVDEVENFLDPRLKDLMPDPSHLKDMDIAAERIAAAVMAGEKIAIFGDYDVDGATSSAVLNRFLRAVGGQVVVYIPDRMTEGYGPNAPALERLREQGASVVVTVDCGITAFDPLESAAAAGMDVIVLDHHDAEPRLPKITAVVDPKRLDETSPLTYVAAVGLSFLFAVAVNRSLRTAGWFDSRPQPDLRQWLDLVALGTVCDVVPLKGLNRAFVTQGLKVMEKWGNPGLSALAQVGEIKEELSAYHLGFVLGPRVNAGGRVGEAGLGAALLATEDWDEARRLAERLNEHNRERQAIEAAVLDAAIDQAQSGKDTTSSVVFVHGEGWHPGVIGIVAGRLKDRFDLPACAISVDGDEAVGSARSVSGIDLGAAILAARQDGILTRGGGHAMAAGFALPTDRLDAFRAFLEERFAARIAEAKIVPTLHVDGALALAGANHVLVSELEKLSPFGAGNAEPRFALANVLVSYSQPVGTNHLRLTLTDRDGKRLNAIAFRCLDTPMGAALRDHGGRPFHLVGKLRFNHWQGNRTVQFQVDDAAFAR